MTLEDLNSLYGFFKNVAAIEHRVNELISERENFQKTIDGLNETIKKLQEEKNG